MPPLLKALRPHQWTKNLAVFVGILFAQKLLDPAVMIPASALFVAFCLAASTVYLMNDIRDRHEDAKHPTKCHRPIASGALAVGVAKMMAVGLAAGSIGVVLLTAWLGKRLEFVADWKPGVIAVGSYLILNVGYTIWLKRIAIADVTCVALGFLIRVVSGPAFTKIEVSSWLILCTLFGSLFLAIAKRRGEQFSTEGSDGGREVLQQYPPAALDLLLAMTATCTLLCYAIYTVVPQTTEKFGTDDLLYTVPFVFLGLGRYVILLYRHKKGEDPAALLFSDRGVLLAVGGWLIVSSLVVGLSPAT